MKVFLSEMLGKHSLKNTSRMWNLFSILSLDKSENPEDFHK